LSLGGESEAVEEVPKGEGAVAEVMAWGVWAGRASTPDIGWWLEEKEGLGWEGLLTSKLKKSPKVAEPAPTPAPVPTPPPRSDASIPQLLKSRAEGSLMFESPAEPCWRTELAELSWLRSSSKLISVKESGGLGGAKLVWGLASVWSWEIGLGEDAGKEGFGNEVEFGSFAGGADGGGRRCWRAEGGRIL
jgi:hypothetical protein